MNGSVLPGSAAVVEVVLGVALVVPLGDGAGVAPLAAGVALELDELPFELPLELVELPFELVELLLELLGEGLDDEPAGVGLGFVQVASGSTYCWLPADGVHPPAASAVELMVSPSVSETRMLMTVGNKRFTTAY